MTYHFSDFTKAKKEVLKWFYEIEESVVITESIYGRENKKEYHLLKLSQTRDDDLTIVYQKNLSLTHKFVKIENCERASRLRFNKYGQKTTVESVPKRDDNDKIILDLYHRPVIRYYKLIAT